MTDTPYSPREKLLEQHPLIDAYYARARSIGLDHKTAMAILDAEYRKAQASPVEIDWIENAKRAAVERVYEQST